MHNAHNNWSVKIKLILEFSKVGCYFYFRQIPTHIVTISTTLMLVLVNDDDGDGDDCDDPGDDDIKAEQFTCDCTKTRDSESRCRDGVIVAIPNSSSCSSR